METDELIEALRSGSLPFNGQIPTVIHMPIDRARYLADLKHHQREILDELRALRNEVGFLSELALSNGKEINALKLASCDIKQTP